MWFGFFCAACLLFVFLGRSLGSGSPVGAAMGRSRGPALQAHRDSVDIVQVDRVSPQYKARLERALKDFTKWLAVSADGVSLALLLDAPLILAAVLKTYGVGLYRRNAPLHRYVDTINTVVDLNRDLQFPLRGAWDLVTVWRLVEPVEPRPPMPRAIFRVMMALALLWGWYSFAAVSRVAFKGISRIGVPLGATRSHFLTPGDLLEVLNRDASLFLSVDRPKTGRRGGAPRDGPESGPGHASPRPAHSSA